MERVSGGVEQRLTAFCFEGHRRRIHTFAGDCVQGKPLARRPLLWVRAVALQARLCEAGFQVRRLSYALGALLPAIALMRWLDRLRPGAPAATVIPLPHWLNRTLIRLQDWETRYLLRRRLPFGVSLVAVAQRE